ncbi:MAG: PucR family transcriptional regulator [Candidatus Dormibacteria bacterium]
MITVADVWRGALPAGTQLVAGAEGLGRPVEWATALRSRPPAFEAIKGGELAFIPVASLRLLDERLTLAGVLASLAERGGVAVAVLGAVSAESEELAERIGLPLLRLPPSTQVADAHVTAVRFILDQRTRLHEHRQLLHSELTELALGGAGAAAIVDRLVALIGGAAAWLDPEGEARHLTDGAVDLQLAGEASAVLRWADTVPLLAADPPVRELGGDGLRLIAPIPGREGVGGFVLLHTLDLEPQFGRVAVSRAAAACAIELDRERAVLRTREELEGGLLESLLSGAYSSEEWVRERLARLGTRLAGSPLVLCLRVDGPPGSEALLGAVRHWLSRRQPDALVAVRSGEVVVLTAGDEAWALRAATELHTSVSSALRPRTVSVGVGRAKPGLPGVPASHREAQRALQLGVRLFGSGRVTEFAGLGLHRLLVALTAQPELEDFFRSNVGRLVDYDQRTRSELMSTLEAFFACHGSPTEMAGRLSLHRNTVLYRLRRIAEVGGVDLDNPDTRLSLHLCLRIREVLAADVAAPL